MIEKYLLKGVRFRWQKPADVGGKQDGAIADSTISTPTMNYIGLAEKVDPELMNTHVSLIGLKMNMPIKYKWLEYAPGRTARTTIGLEDVLTGFMSGCIITRSNEPEKKYISHIGTIDGNASVNKMVKEAYAAVMPEQTTGFNPADKWTFDELSAMQKELSPSFAPKICGLVTTGGIFYSVAFITEGNNEWICLGCKTCTPLQTAALKSLLTKG